MNFFYDHPSQHPDAIEIEIAGVGVDWLLTKTALQKAKKEGVDLASFQEIEEDDAEGNLGALAALVWAGTLPFQEVQDTPTLTDIEAVLTPKIAAQVGPRVMAQFEGLTDEEVEAVMGKE